jgi:hypothetical protein
MMRVAMSNQSYHLIDLIGGADLISGNEWADEIGGFRMPLVDSQIIPDGHSLSGGTQIPAGKIATGDYPNRFPGTVIICKIAK